MAAVFVLPTPTAGQLGPVAAYLSTAGWAAAGARVFGRSWIVAPSGVLTPAEARQIGTRSQLRSAPHRTTPRYPYVPAPIKTLVKDIRQYRRARIFSLGDLQDWEARDVELVWQRHELFTTTGIDLAESLGCPSVLFVPTVKVWEAQRWGTHRPGWGSLLERWGEHPSLARADVIACGSEEVAEQAERIGAPPERIVVTPTGVDLALFEGAVTERDRLRAELGLADRFVVGWVGSFRPFHAVERAVAAVAGMADTSLLLVGDGPQRRAIESSAAEQGVHVVATGTVGHDQLPAHLAAMDVGLVLAPLDEGFHYSPLKLAEYLAAGLAVVAPDVATIAGRLTNGTDAVLVPPGDGEALREAIGALRADPALAARLGQRARVTAEAHWSWDEQVRRVRDAAARVTPS